MKITELEEKHLKLLRKAETRLIWNDCENVYWSVGQDRYPIGLYAIIHPGGFIYNFGNGLVSQDDDVDADYNFRLAYNAKGEILFIRENETEETEFFAGQFYNKKTKPQAGEYFFVFVTFGKYTELYCLHGDFGSHHVYRLASKKDAEILLREIGMLLPSFNTTVGKEFLEMMKDVELDG